MKINFPRLAVNSSPASIKAGTPVVSMTILEPSPPVSFLTSSTILRSAEDVSRQSVAPSVFASSSLDLTRSTPMTFWHPTIFAACRLSISSPYRNIWSWNVGLLKWPPNPPHLTPEQPHYPHSLPLQD